LNIFKKLFGITFYIAAVSGYSLREPLFDMVRHQKVHHPLERRVDREHLGHDVNSGSAIGDHASDRANLPFDSSQARLDFSRSVHPRPSVHTLVDDSGDLCLGIVVPPPGETLPRALDPLMDGSDTEAQVFQALPAEIRRMGALEPFGCRLDRHLNSRQDCLEPATLLVSFHHAGKPKVVPL
jgi:hypothetical protein